MSDTLSGSFADRCEDVREDDRIDVVLLRFPAEQGRLGSLRTREIPRLLLVADEEAPPACSDALEDWIWASAPEADRAHRAAVLACRADTQTVPPTLDEDGLLRFGARCAPLSPTETVVVSQFIAHFDRLVKRADLARAVWPSGAPRSRSLDTHILRLRRRVVDAGLEIDTIRARGWVMRAANGVRSRQPVDA